MLRTLSGLESISGYSKADNSGGSVETIRPDRSKCSLPWGLQERECLKEYPGGGCARITCSRSGVARATDPP